LIKPFVSKRKINSKKVIDQVDLSFQSICSSWRRVINFINLVTCFGFCGNLIHMVLFFQVKRFLSLNWRFFESREEGKMEQHNSWISVLRWRQYIINDLSQRITPILRDWNVISRGLSGPIPCYAFQLGYFSIISY